MGGRPPAELMPSPTSNNASNPTSPSSINQAQAFLERERASLEAINAIGIPSGSQSQGSSRDSISNNVASLAIDRQLVEEDRGMDVDETPVHMDVDHNLQRESTKIQ